ncbi:MAG: GerMN domain-containing protein [Terriglobales bacterium]
MIPRHLIIGVSAMLALALGMSVYVWHMRSRVRQAETQPEFSRPVAAPVQGPTEQVTLFVAYDDPGALRAQAASIPLPAGRQERAQELLRALLGLYLDKSSSHALGPGSEVREVYLVDPGLAVIDVNDAFADGHRSGVLIEELTVASLVQTLASNIPGINRVKILVGGKDRETLAGHADLSCTYDVSAVSQMVAEMQ